MFTSSSKQIKSGRTRLRMESLEVRAVPARTLTVDDDGLQNPDAEFSSIQAAVNAATNGDDIAVYAGTYSEQVVIPSNITNLGLFGVGNLEGIRIAPTNFNADSTEAIIHVNGARNVEISNFLITGEAAPTGTTEGANYGVLVDNGGEAEVFNTHITTIRDIPLTGEQEGIGIQFGFTNSKGQVLSGGSGAAIDNLIEDYQKGGVVVIGSQSKADVDDNTIIGVGATSVIAQNGIQISNGAKAEVSGNTVSDNNYTGTDFVSVGILLFEAAANGRVEDNTVFDNNEGILLYFTDRNRIRNNESFDNTANGIGLFQSNQNRVDGNNVHNNGNDGINIDTSSFNRIEDNDVFFNVRYGIALEATATNNIVRHNELGGNGAGNIFVGNPNNTVNSNTIVP